MESQSLQHHTTTHFDKPLTTDTDEIAFVSAAVYLGAFSFAWMPRIGVSGRRDFPKRLHIHHPPPLHLHPVPVSLLPVYSVVSIAFHSA